MLTTALGPQIAAMLEAADTIEGLLRGLANDFGFGRVGADGGAAEGGESLAGANAGAIIHQQRLDHAGRAERERGFAFVREKAAGAENACLLPQLDAVHFDFDGRDRLRLCRFGCRFGR